MDIQKEVRDYGRWNHNILFSLVRSMNDRILLFSQALNSSIYSINEVKMHLMITN